MTIHHAGKLPMLRISLQYLWDLANGLQQLGRLDTTKPTTKMEFLFDVHFAASTLDQLLSGSVFAATLRSSRPLASELRSEISSLLPDRNKPDDHKNTLEAYEIANVVRAYDRFRIAFLAELAILPAYFVTQKSDKDTLTLLDQPERMFPADLLSKVPEAAYDVGEIGKALCFEVATACGYHVFRVTEAVLRRYYTHVTGGAPPPKMRNIMVYVKAIRAAKCGDERILSVIEQLSKLHRNPIAHPEVALSLDEAIATLGMAQSVITAMLAVLPVVPKTTATLAP